MMDVGQGVCGMDGQPPTRASLMGSEAAFLEMAVKRQSELPRQRVGR